MASRLDVLRADLKAAENAVYKELRKLYPEGATIEARTQRNHLRPTKLLVTGQQVRSDVRLSVRYPNGFTSSVSIADVVR